MNERPRVLIVEEEKDVALEESQRLAREGFACEYAHDGLRGLLALQHTRPDVLILDCPKSGTAGLDVLVALDRWPAHLRPRVIVQSDPAAGGLAAKALSLGAQIVLQKPCRFEALLGAVRGVCPR